MNTKISFTLFLILIVNLLMSSIALSADVDFTATPMQGEAPLMVNFVSTGSAVTTIFNWISSDGQTASGSTTTMTFSQPGEYIITLNASVNGIVSPVFVGSESKTIVVNPPITADDYEPDNDINNKNDRSQARLINYLTTNDFQIIENNHTIHNSNDVDWYKFYIWAPHNNDQATRSSPFPYIKTDKNEILTFELFDSSGNPVERFNNNDDAELNTYLFTVNESGYYFLKVSSNEATTYSISIGPGSSGAGWGRIELIVEDITNSTRIRNVSISSSIDGIKTSLPQENGKFLGLVQQGTHDFFYFSPGYIPRTVKEVEIKQSGDITETQDILIQLTPENSEPLASFQPAINLNNNNVLNDLRNTSSIVGANAEISLEIDNMTNYLMAKAGSIKYLLRPIDITTAPTGSSSGIKVSGDGLIQLISDSERLVTLPAEPQEIGSLSTKLQSIGLELQQKTYGMLEVSHLSNPTPWFAARPAYNGNVAEVGATPDLRGLPSAVLANTVSYVHYYFSEGVLYRQTLFSSPAYWDSLKSFLNASGKPSLLDIEGNLSFERNNVFHRAIMDYVVQTSNDGTGGVQLLQIEDINNDGTQDFQVIYANGDKQIMYILP